MKPETLLGGADPPDKDHYSEIQVMRSGAGFYLGTLWKPCGKCEECKKHDYPDWWTEPGSRESEYFRTQADAEKALAAFKAGHPEDARLRE